MKKYFFTTVTLALILSTNLPNAVSASAVVDRVIAVVNDDIITLSDLQREAAKNPKEKIDDRLLLEDLINRKLQMAAAKRGGIDVTEKELDEAVSDIMKRNLMGKKSFEEALAKEGITFEQYRSELREQITLSRTFSRYVRAGLAVDDEEIRAYYEKNRKEYALPEEIRVRHIFLKFPEKASPARIAELKEKARAVYDRAVKGEDFIGLVKEVSQAETAAQDGDLGYMQRGHALPEIEMAARSMKPGEIAGPLQAETGFHIMRLEDVRTPIKPLEKVREEIMNILYQQKLENTYRAWLQTLRSESHIENRL